MKSRNNHFYFKNRDLVLADSLFYIREGEDRIVNHLQRVNCNAKYCIIGISESIGPQANFGRPGAENAFAAFMHYFLPMPYQGQDFCVMGEIVCKSIEFSDVIEASKLVEELDDFVFEVLSSMIEPNQIPIVIGGGHNNALPLMRWANKKRGSSSVLNFDAHADCRETNRRHSGNSFSFALDDGILKQYTVLGLHSNYVNSYIKGYLKNPKIVYSYYESYLDGNSDLEIDIVNFLNNNPVFGLELDLDAVESMPSSAMSPSGWNLDSMRKIIRILSSKNSVYFHLTEAGPSSETEKRKVGKSLCYLCIDFMVD